MSPAGQASRILRLNPSSPESSTPFSPPLERNNPHADQIKPGALNNLPPLPTESQIKVETKRASELQHIIIIIIISARVKRSDPTMFFFFVGGVEQGAGRVLKEAAGRCLRCGGTADLVETEKVLKIFFVPAWRWPGKDPAYLCRECGLLAPGSLGGEPGLLLPRGERCGACSRAVDPQFRFCPFCGSAL